MAAPFNVLVSSAAAFTEWKELNIQGMYLFHTPLGGDANQAQVTDNKTPIGIGAIVVNNWSVYDGPGTDAKLVARAQGSHILSGKWVNSFSLVFEDGRFKGSTLEVMGLVVETGEWAIVGGTGEFALANGIISKKFHEQRTQGNIIELTIRAFYPVLKEPRFPATKIPPVGGTTGTLKDIPDAPKRLQSITVATGLAVKSIAFSYVDYADQNRSAGPWGGPGGQDETETIQLDESELLTEVSGTIGNVDGAKVITSIKFVTSLNKTYGPYGAWGLGDDTSFSIPEKPGSSIVGFSACTAGKYVDAIGAYLQPL